VIVKLVSFRISILGEVNKPGYYYIYQDQLNVLEAIAMAGDLTSFGDRKHVKILRQSKSGVEVSYLDLRDPAVIQAPTYYLKPNDVIYIQPLRYKNARNNITNISWLFAGVSTLILVLNFVKKN
jgi:polysaccharide export outer membrane protein